MNRFCFLALFSCMSAAASAHEGHALTGVSHWHATDVLGFVASLAAVAAALWWRGRK